MEAVLSVEKKLLLSSANGVWCMSGSLELGPGMYSLLNDFDKPGGMD